MAVKYSKAPISELILGINFNSNVLIRDNKFILFELMIELGKDFPIINTHPAIADEDVVNGMIQQSVDYSRSGFSTYRLISTDNKWHIVILQNTITFHWVRQDIESVGNYPGFDEVFKKFITINNVIEKQFSINGLNLDKEIKSYYLCYNDRVPLEMYKTKEFELSDVITVTSPSFELNGKDYKSNNCINKYSIPCDAINGNLIIAINTPTIPGIGQLLIVDCKIKGKFSNENNIEKWFYVAHDIQVSFFENIFNKSILKTWE